MNKRLIAVVLVVAVLAGVALYFVLRTRPLAVGLQPGTVNYPMMHAIQGGFFERSGLVPEVTVFRSAGDAQDALLGGSIFIDAVIPIQAISEIERKQPGAVGILALLVSDAEHPLDYLVVPADSVIESAEELSGKTVVVFPGTYSATLTGLALATVGVDSVIFLKKAPADMALALREGEADAGLLYDPVATQAVAQGWGRVLERAFWERTLLPEIVVGAYAYNKQLAAADPATTDRVLKAITEAVLDARRDPARAKTAAAAYLAPFASVLPDVADARVVLADEIDPALIDATLEFYVTHGILKKATDLRSALHVP